MVNILKYEDFVYSSEYKQKHNRFSFSELLGDFCYKEFKGELWDLYQDIVRQISYNDYLKKLIEEVKSKEVTTYPYVARNLDITNDEYNSHIKIANQTFDKWFENEKNHKIQEIKHLIYPMNNTYSQLSKFLNTNTYLPFEIYFEDIFTKGNESNLSFVEFFDKLIKDNKSKASSIKGSNTKSSIYNNSTITKTKSDIIEEETDQEERVESLLERIKQEMIPKTREQRVKELAEKTLPKPKSDTFIKQNISDLGKCHQYTDEYEYLINYFDDRCEYHILCPNTHKDDIKIYFLQDGLYVEKNNIKEPYQFQPKFSKLFFGNDERFDREKVTSELKDGILLIKVPYKQFKQEPQINIKVN